MLGKWKIRVCFVFVLEICSEANSMEMAVALRITKAYGVAKWGEGVLKQQTRRNFSANVDTAHTFPLLFSIRSGVPVSMLM